MHPPAAGSSAFPPLASANPKPPDPAPLHLLGAPLSFAAVTAARAINLSRFPDIQLPNKSYGRKDGVPSITFSPAEYQAATKKFEHSLVAKFQVGRPALHEIRDFMLRNWKLSGKITISAIWDDRHVAIILDSDQDANSILASPLRRIGHTLFRLFRWTPNLSAKSEEPRTTKWVRFPGLPLELFDKSVIRTIVSSFARFLDIDERTKTLTGLNFARACIELDVKESIPDRVWINLPDDKGFFQNVVVEGNLSYCTRCKKHGHAQEECRKNAQHNPGVAREAPLQSAAASRSTSKVIGKVDQQHDHPIVELTTHHPEALSDSNLPLSEWKEVKSRKSRNKEQRGCFEFKMGAEEQPTSKINQHELSKSAEKAAPIEDTSNVPAQDIQMLNDDTSGVSTHQDKQNLLISDFVESAGIEKEGVIVLSNSSNLGDCTHPDTNISAIKLGEIQDPHKDDQNHPKGDAIAKDDMMKERGIVCSITDTTKDGSILENNIITAAQRKVRFRAERKAKKAKETQSEKLKAVALRISFLRIKFAGCVALFLGFVPVVPFCVGFSFRGFGLSFLALGSRFFLVLFAVRVWL